MDEALERSDEDLTAAAERPSTTPAGGHGPAIASHRLVSDGRSAALIRPNAEIDWWCAPAFDSPPLLWSLLDRAGASARWLGVRMVQHSTSPAGPTAHTTLRGGTGRIECWDGLLGTGPYGVGFVRLVRSEDADLDVTHELALGGFDLPWATWSATAALVGDTTLQVHGGASRLVNGRWLHTRLRAPRGAWTALVVASEGASGARAEDLVASLEAAEEDARRLVADAHLPRHHPERAADALAVLDACTYRATGAVVASVTTSLPEAVGGDRQFDYRYSWLRDAALAVSVAALLGRRRAAEAYLGFVRRITTEAGVPSGPLVDVRGKEVPAERDVPGVAGWGGSIPVRVGNAARGQRQYDALGMLLESISVYLQTGGSLDDDTWGMVRAVADQVAAEDARPSSGIWEFREERPLVSGDIGRWMALDRAIWIARGWRPLARRRHWKRARDQIRQRVLAALTADGRLPQSYEDPQRSDAASLMAALFGMLPRSDHRARRLVDVTIEDLEVGPFLYRYEPGSDGFAGQEGAFVPVSWWAVAALAATGRVDEARERADALCAALPRLMSEEVDPESGAALGNVPLVWSHIEAARALYILDAADLRRRYGRAGLWAWRIGRYLRLRWGWR